VTDPAGPPAISIGTISIRGVDAATAQGLGPAIRTALADAAHTGTIRSGHRASLSLNLSSGTSARDIARAVVRALEHG
jgi:hypothetical protein